MASGKMKTCSNLHLCGFDGKPVGVIAWSASGGVQYIASLGWQLVHEQFCEIEQVGHCHVFAGENAI